MRTFVIVPAAVVGFAGTLLVLHLRPATASVPSVPVSNNAAVVPARSDLTIAALPLDDPSVRVTGAQALATATSEFNVQPGEVDPVAGVQLVRLTMHGDLAHQSEPDWVVTVNRAFHPPGPAGASIITHKMCVVVNATTGKYEYAYLTG